MDYSFEQNKQNSYAALNGSHFFRISWTHFFCFVGVFVLLCNIAAMINILIFFFQLVEYTGIHHGFKITSDGKLQLST